MKKFLLIIALLVLSKWNILSAQTLFNAPDTVCINQPVKLTSNVFNQSSYYWGFCSGYLLNTPAGTNLGDNFNFNLPSNIDIVQDSGNYYGFVVNAGTTEFLRLNYGNSLSNIPTVTNFGNLTNGLPQNPTSLYVVHDTAQQKWFVFVTGGWTQATSSVARIDFDRHLNHPSPNIANFGNFGNVLNGPKGIFVEKDVDDQWWGYLVNHNNSQLVRLKFGPNISTTPMTATLGNVFGTINLPTDLAAVRDNGKWYLFITNAATGASAMTKVFLGTRLDTLTPGGISLGSFDFRVIAPSSLTATRDCGQTYLYVTDSTTSQLVGIKIPEIDNISSYYAVNYSVVGGMNFPAGISSILRDKDDLYGFIVNARDSTLTRINFQPCTNATIPSFSEVAPPVYTYTTPGEYNVYYVINQGLPTMQVECKLITVLDYPTMYLDNDTTICEGDTIRLHAISNPADSIRWTSAYAIDTTNLYTDSVKVYPHYNSEFPVKLYYPFGCIVDTVIKVRVKRVHADAGPDRWIHDGATTIIGGTGTNMDDVFNDHSYLYSWTPYQFLSDSLSPHPFATPPYDFTYYLTVRDTSGGIYCVAKDTMVVHVDCGDFYVPNAFAPNSSSNAVNRFGVLNKGLASLSFFRVYDRWGALVFETTDPSQGWDGQYNGKPAPVGVYVWIAEGYCYGGKLLKKQGNVTLLR